MINQSRRLIRYSGSRILPCETSAVRFGILRLQFFKKSLPAAVHVPPADTAYECVPVCRPQGIRLEIVP
jgi:hypothetical protein